MLLDDSESFSSHQVALFHKKHKLPRARWAALVDFPSHGIINVYLNPVVDISKFSWTILNLQGFLGLFNNDMKVGVDPLWIR